MPQITIKQLNYMMVFVKMFADRFGLSEKQAFNYLDAHKGFAFVDKHYEAIHTLDFAYAIEDVQEVCRANGGEIVMRMVSLPVRCHAVLHVSSSNGSTCMRKSCLKIGNASKTASNHKR